MSAEWYVARPGQQQVGPLSAQQLKQMAASGQVSGSDLVWKQGMPQWVPASQIKGLVGSDSVQRAPDPMPAPVAPDPFGGGGGAPALDDDGGSGGRAQRGGDPWYYGFLETYATVFMWLGIAAAGLTAVGGLIFGVMSMMGPFGFVWLGMIQIVLALLFGAVGALGAMFAASLVRLAADVGRTLRSIERKSGT